MRQLTAIKLDDTTAERVRREHHDAIQEVQQAPALAIKTIAGQQLANGVTTPIAHTLGRSPVFVTASIPRGATSAGYIVEVRTSTVDRTKYIQLQANGYGATITVDLEVR